MVVVVLEPPRRRRRRRWWWSLPLMVLFAPAPGPLRRGPWFAASKCDERHRELDERPLVEMHACLLVTSCQFCTESLASATKIKTL